MNKMKHHILIVLISQTIVHFTEATDNSSCKLTKLTQGHYEKISPILEKNKAVLLILVGLGGMSVLLAIIHRTIRKYVYHDDKNLDTMFDAGGRVSFGLTSVTVMSQMLWPADFLQSSTLMSKTGLGGSLFYSFGVVMAIVMFPLLSIRLKVIAPGAKTYLQIVYARFGKATHILYCCIALFVNLIIILALVLAAKITMGTLVKDISNEMIVILLAVLFGSYCMIGGLGTTFYISYFTTGMTFVSVLVFIVHVSYLDNEGVTSVENMFEAMSCIEAPNGNYGNSYMTFISKSGILYGIVMFCMTTALNFLDQGNWQSRIAAKPSQGVCGFLVASFLWFGIPTAISMTATMTYMSMSYENGTQLLSHSDIEAGFITPFTLIHTMGPKGAYLLLIMTTMALMSTGSGEVMAISSILVYDIYKVYINPFSFKAEDHDGDTPNGGEITGEQSSRDIYRIHASKDTFDNSNDTQHPSSFYIFRSDDEIESYKKYEELLLHYKSWSMVWITIGIVPYGLLIIYSDINLTWGMFFLQTLLSGFIIPMLLTIAWDRCTGLAVIVGSLSGLVAAFVAMLIIGETAYEDGLSDFLTSTSSDLSLIGGIVSGIIVSAIFTVLISLCTYSKDGEEVWTQTLKIDNPLTPWRNLYKRELSKFDGERNITTKHMKSIFKRTSVLAYVGGVFSIIIFLVVIPSITLGYGVLSFSQFRSWLTTCQIWVMVGASFAILVPPIQEIVQVIHQHLRNKKKMKYATKFSSVELLPSCKH